MQKLNHLSIVLQNLGLASESIQIQKLAREYVSRVAEKGLSKRFYQIVRVIEEEVFNYKKELVPYLIKEAASRNTAVTYDIISSAVTTCLNSWGNDYAKSIGAKDGSIPPWLFNFLEVKIFPILKESFSKAIEDLPADSETKTGLQAWLSQTTLKQLGAPTLSDVLDAGTELWTTFLANAIHEIHHNILNHSAWHRFSTHGNDASQYNLLDAMEEGFAVSIQNFPNSYNEEKMWDNFAASMVDFLSPMVEKIFPQNKSQDLGIMLHQKWDLVYQALDNIETGPMGIKLPEKKKDFLRKVFQTFYQDYLTEDTYFTIRNWTYFRMFLTNSVKKVWSQPVSEEEPVQWDFLTGDDETLLINLMKDLDSKSDLLWDTWESYKEEFYKISNKETQGCIDDKIKYLLGNY